LRTIHAETATRTSAPISATVSRRRDPATMTPAIRRSWHDHLRSAATIQPHRVRATKDSLSRNVNIEAFYAPSQVLPIAHLRPQSAVTDLQHALTDCVHRAHTMNHPGPTMPPQHCTPIRRPSSAGGPGRAGRGGRGGHGCGSKSWCARQPGCAAHPAGDDMLRAPIDHATRVRRGDASAQERR
jgi:hypothetical protein